MNRHQPALHENLNNESHCHVSPFASNLVNESRLVVLPAVHQAPRAIPLALNDGEISIVSSNFRAKRIHGRAVIACQFRSNHILYSNIQVHIKTCIITTCNGGSTPVSNWVTKAASLWPAGLHDVGLHDVGLHMNLKP